jgi:UDP-MurNAc hydroxylase
MKITFVNHAGFIVESSDVKLICDPWIEGRSFDNGWELLVSSEFSYDDFSSITHIWFSHEHPDHFSPTNILKIKEEHRKNITVLFQETKDKKVVNWCIKNGFKDAVELSSGINYTISERFEVICTKVFDDSWLFVKSDGKTLLNINDCLIRSKDDAKVILNIVRSPIDILFTQFSYAQYEGNFNEPHKRRIAAKRKIEHIENQLSVLNPDYIVPFASFVYFCHQENNYMNDETNKVSLIYNHLNSSTYKSKPVVLFPGDVWDLDKKFDSTNSLVRYDEAYNALSNIRFIESKLVEESKLIEAGNTLKVKIRKRFGFRISLFMLKPLRVSIIDINRTGVFSPYGGLKILENNSRIDPDIKISSEVLFFCLKFNWGMNTTHVNGRIFICGTKGCSQYAKYETIMNAMNHEHNYNGYREKIALRVRRLLSKKTIFDNFK